MRVAVGGEGDIGWADGRGGNNLEWGGGMPRKECHGIARRVGRT